MRVDIAEFGGNEAKSGWTLKVRRNVSKLLLTAMCVTTVVVIATAQDKLFSIPNWHVGDRWTVRGWDTLVTPDPTNRMERLEIRNGKPYDVTCEVTRVTLVGTQECFEVTAARLQGKDEIGTESIWAAYYATNDFVLVKVVCKDSRASRCPEFKFAGNRNRPTTTENIPSCIPFDTPSFVGGTNLEGRDQFGYTIEQKMATEEGNPGHYTFTLRTKYATKERVMVQEWEASLPWWRNCILLQNGSICRTWEMVLPGAGTNTVTDTRMAPLIAQVASLPIMGSSVVQTNRAYPTVYPDGVGVVPGLSYPCEDCLYPVPVDYTGPCPWCRAPCRVVRATYKVVVEPHGTNQPFDRLRLFDKLGMCIATFEADTGNVASTSRFIGTWKCAATDTQNVRRDSSSLQFETNGVVVFQRNIVRQERGTVHRVKVQFIQGMFTVNEAQLECDLTMWRPLELRRNSYEVR